MAFADDTAACCAYSEQMLAACLKNDSISPRLYEEYGVNLGLRDERGNGVLTGLTNVSKITSSRIEDGRKVPDAGRLWYRGHTIEELIASLGDDLGFEKIAIFSYRESFLQMPRQHGLQRLWQVAASCLLSSCETPSWICHLVM